MMKKRRAPLRLAVAEDGEEDADEEDLDDGRPRPAPNTNFLGRLVRGVATGNQRQIDTTTSNAANLSIGATGAASLRLQLQRAAIARTARFQTLRRVVLSSAAQQRLTLCTALLAEVAQGFGFRLTMRRPDGQEVGARQAMAAVTKIVAQPAAETGSPAKDEAGAAGQENDAAGTDVQGCGEGDDADVQGSDGVAHDPLDALEPLEVDLDLDRDSNGLLQQTPQKSLVGGGLATRLAKSPGGSRPARAGGMNALLSGRLTSATLCSMGLMGIKKTAAAQAVQAARRRVLLRAASNAAAEEVAAAAAVATADAAPGANAVAAAAAASEGDAGADAGNAATNSGSGRRIVWDPDKLAKHVTVASVTASGAAVASAKHEDAAGVAPAAKRMRTSAAAAEVAEAPTGAVAATPPAVGIVSSGGKGGELGEPRDDIGGEEAVDGVDKGKEGAEEQEEEEGEHGAELAVAEEQEEEGISLGGSGEGGGEGEGEDEDEAAVEGDPGEDHDDEAMDGGVSDSSKRRDSAVIAVKEPTRARTGTPATPGPAAAGSGSTRPRAPTHTGRTAGSSRTGAVPLAATAAEQDSSEQAERAPGAGAPRSGASSRATSASAGGRTGGVGGLGSPAGKLFGAAMRQLQRRSHG